MNSTAKLTQIIGTLADQKEDIRNYSESDINSSVAELLKRDAQDSDGSTVKVYDVLGTSLQNIHLSERFVAAIMYKLLQNPIHHSKKKLRGYLPLALNHPNISQMDYVNLLGGYLLSGFWLSNDYSHHLVKHEKNNWDPERVLAALVLNIPSLRECINEDPVRNEGIDYLLSKFFTVFSQIIDVNDPKVIEGFSQLFSKLGPMKIKKLNSNRTDTLIIPVLDPTWGESYLTIKQVFLEKFNKLPYEPNPYGPYNK